MSFPLPRRSSVRAALLGFVLAGCLAAHPGQGAETNLVAAGAPPELTERLTAASSTLALRSETGVQETLAAALSDYRTLVQVLYDAGHFAPEVSIRLDGREAALIHPLNPPRQINKIEISINTGPAFRFSRAEIAPWPGSSEVKVPNEFQTGRPATTGTLRNAGAAGIEAWRQAGHAKARLGGQSITANHRAATLDARLRLAPGPRLRLGDLHLTTASAVRPDAIQRIAGFATSKVYHPDLVATAATRLRRTGAFSAVTIRAVDQPNADDTLDYRLAVEDMPPRRLTFGVELSSTDGIELNTSWMHRNLFGGAEKLRFEARLSGIASSNDIDGRIALRLDQPATLGPDDNLFYLLEAERLDEEHYTATRGLGGLGVRRVFSDDFFAEAGLGFSSILATDAFGKRRFKYAAGFLRAELDRRNSKVDATDGYFFNAQLQPFLGLDGTDSGFQFKFDGRFYHGFGGSDRLVLAARAQLGSVIGPSLSNTAPTLLFFSGGAGSVRGHEYQSLGIPVGTKTAGGRGYLALTGELRGKLSDKLSLVGFYDLGFVDSNAFISGDSSNHAGAGLGLRYDVAGIGPLRLDLAYPVNGGTEDGLQFYIGIGQSF